MKLLGRFLFCTALAFLAIAAYATFLPAPKTQQVATAPEPAPTPRTFAASGVTPRSADSFVDAIGVNVHLFYQSYNTNSHFSDVFNSVIKPRMSELGVRVIRDHVTTTGSGPGEFKAMAVKMGSLRTDTGFPIRLIQTTHFFKAGVAIDSRYPSHACFTPKLVAMIQGGTVPCGPLIGQSIPAIPIVAVEMPNEIDHCASFEAFCQSAVDDPAIPGTWYEKSIVKSGDWPGLIHTQTQDLYNALQSSSVTRNIPIIGPSFVHVKDFAGIPYGGSTLLTYLQGQANLYGAGNAHVYCTTRPISWCLDTPAINATVLAPVEGFFTGKPIWTTETGSSVYDMSASIIHSELQIAKMTLRGLFDLYDRGHPYVVLYELFDEQQAATPREQHFGLINSDGTVKPSFTALKNLIDLLEEAPGVTINPVPLSYSITKTGGGTSGLRSTLFRKTNGNYYIVVRNEAITITDADQSVASTVTITDAISSVKVYRPRLSTAPQQTFTTGTFSLTVPDDILVLEVIPPPPPPTSGGGDTGGTTGGGATGGGDTGGTTGGGTTGGSTTGGSTGGTTGGTVKKATPKPTSTPSPGATAAPEEATPEPVATVEATPAPVDESKVIAEPLGRTDVVVEATWFNKLLKSLDWFVDTQEKRERTQGIGYGTGVFLLLVLLGRSILVHRLYGAHVRQL